MTAHAPKTCPTHIIGMALAVTAAGFVPPFGIVLGIGYLVVGDGMLVDSLIWSGICQLLAGLLIGNLAALLKRNLRSPGAWKLVWACVAVGFVLAAIGWMYFQAGFPELNTNRYDDDAGWLLYEEDSQFYWGTNSARLTSLAALPINLGLWLRLRSKQVQPLKDRRNPVGAAVLAWAATVSVAAVMTIPRDVWFADGQVRGDPRWWIGNLLPHGGHVVSLWWWIAPPLWLSGILLGTYLLRRRLLAEPG